MFYGHIGAMDVMALSLKLAARMIEDGKLDRVWQNAMPAGRASWGNKLWPAACRWIILPDTLSSII
jgi:xylose isomerase